MSKVTVHLLLEEMHGWILAKLGRIILSGRGFKGVHMVHVATMGAQG